jgi:hypothetical protein
MPKSQLQPFLVLSKTLAMTPDRVKRVIERCLEADPRDRYQLANEVAKALTMPRRRDCKGSRLCTRLRKFLGALRSFPNLEKIANLEEF